MVVIESCCCGRWSNRTGSLIIGTLLLVLTFCFLIICIGLVAAWPDFDTNFLAQRLNFKIGNASLVVEPGFVERMESVAKEMNPMWKKEFISLYCFLPWFALANVLLIIGVIKEIRLLVLIWIVFTVAFLIWTFTLVAIMFDYEATPDFVAGVAVAQIAHFAILSCFILVVFSYYQEIQSKTIKEVKTRAEEYLTEEA